jgi:hypothetical protein
MYVCVYIYIAVISVINVESVTMEAEHCVLYIAALHLLLSTMNANLRVKFPLFFLPPPPPPILAKF